ncbi:MAG: dTMP kinase [Rhodocyclaceae bacterium]|nr:dTMP kinase [Rhodocyclaceae bacterium]
MNQRGKFITLEGLDGAGKSTHLRWLVDFLRRRGHEVVEAREPGGTPVGEALRQILLHQPMHAETEALLMFAARREHLARVILPALEQGAWVVCDRFTDASFAYQGGGRGIPFAKLRILEAWVHAELQPDLTLLFDVPESVAQERLQTEGRMLDRFEQERIDFHRRVRQAYLERARENPQRIRLLDGRQTVAEIQKQLEVIISSV